MDIRCSCAFNEEAITEVNKKAQAIDERLFLFTYYSPKPFPETESPLVQFYTAVINLYGLFWDCGAFVKNYLLHKSKNQRNMFEKAKSTTFEHLCPTYSVAKSDIPYSASYRSGVLYANVL